MAQLGRVKSCNKVHSGFSQGAHGKTTFAWKISDSDRIKPDHKTWATKEKI